MNDSDPAPRDDGTDAIYAAIGRAVLASGGIDNMFAMMLHHIGSSFHGLFELELASIIVFSARTIEQRIEVIKDILEMRLRPRLELPHYDYDYRCAAFVFKSYNMTTQNIRRFSWIRNLCAHGNLMLGDEPRLIPAAFDVKGMRKLYDRDVKYSMGLTAKEITEEASKLHDAHKSLASVSRAAEEILFNGPTETFETIAMDLAKGLGIDPPRRPKTRPSG